MAQYEVQTYFDEPIEGEDVVEFRLLYSGRLLGSSDVKTRANIKHEIRRQFHPQLKRLWSINPAIRHMTDVLGVAYIAGDPQRWKPPAQPTTIEMMSQLRLEACLHYLAEQWQRNGYNFIPLVTEVLCLRCSIEVLLLRPDEPKYVMQSGDLDAKVKTVFDALRMPKTLAEAGGTGPQTDETPFYCLLEDDKLVSEVRVTTDELLMLPKQTSVNPHDAFLVVKVKLKPIQTTQLNSGF